MFCQLNSSKKLQGTKPNEKKSPVKFHHVASLVLNSTVKAFPKSASDETLKAGSKQTKNLSIKNNVVKDAGETKNIHKGCASNISLVDAVNESDDDDSVFINENKPKKSNATLVKHKSDVNLSIKPALSNVSSVMLNDSNDSALNVQPVVSIAAKNPISRELNVTSETVIR